MNIRNIRKVRLSDVRTDFQIQEWFDTGCADFPWSAKIDARTGICSAINVPATGDLSPRGARELAKVLLLAADLAEGKITIE